MPALAPEHIVTQGAEEGQPAQPGKDSQVPECFMAMPQDLMKSFSHTKRVGNYLVGKMINKGSFAKVMEGLHVPTGEKVAIKVIDKKKAKQDTYVRKNMKREPRIHQMIKHPNVVQLFETLETENSYYMAMELCQGGDLMDRICEKKKLEEKEVRKYTRQILSAVEHLHRHTIVHRDLKIENFLLDENNNIKIVDFGLSNTLKSDSQELLNTQCGSPAYAAPELLAHQKYGPKVDVWSIGVSMFAMLTGMLPFTVEPFNIKQLHQKMINGDISSIPPEISSGAVHFMLSLLEPDPAKRPTVREAMEEKWLNEGFIRRPLHSVVYKNRLRSDELNSMVLNFMAEKTGLGLTEIINTLINNRPSPSMATYYLLLKKLARYQKGIKNKKAENISPNKRPTQQRENAMPKQSKQSAVRSPDQNLSSALNGNKQTVEQAHEENDRESETTEQQHTYIPTMKEVIKEEEIAISLEKHDHCFAEVSNFANRELVYLGPPESSSRRISDQASSEFQGKSDETCGMAIKQDLQNQKQGTYLQAINQQEFEGNLKQTIDSLGRKTPRSLLESKAHNRHPATQHETRFKDLLQAMEDQSTTTNWRFTEKDGHNFAIIDPPQLSLLPKLKQGIFKDKLGQKINWVGTPHHGTNVSSPFLVNSGRHALLPPSRQQTLIFKSLHQSKERTQASLTRNIFKRDCIQLRAPQQPTDLNLPVLTPALQSKSDKKGGILRLDFM
ncbi:hormonally up-regulated neu tumor-associated kinase homolog A isoform X2 [Stegostoma tigrinum]|uniref:hormonally up-regulated neu tumor-associated kinase homolog A isoform X2 n=1 Tax=Stegostoma tigrinum TaxID=3053191 RepID=UPI00202B16D8|nr:hormonally up-regulated neu tumor-associated kinase homolog A isoform X2 [Stegostoma tigrinum]